MNVLSKSLLAAARGGLAAFLYLKYMRPCPISLHGLHLIQSREHHCSRLINGQRSKRVLTHVSEAIVDLLGYLSGQAADKNGQYRPVRIDVIELYAIQSWEIVWSVLSQLKHVSLP